MIPPQSGPWFKAGTCQLCGQSQIRALGGETGSTSLMLDPFRYPKSRQEGVGQRQGVR